MSDRKRKLTILFDRLIGESVFFIVNIFKQKEKKSTQIKNILLIRPGGIGDYLLSIPSFKYLRKTFPEAKITMFIFKRNKISLELYSDFDKVVVIDEPKNLINFIKKRENYDLVVDFDQYRKIPSIIAKISKANIRIGFDNAGKGKSYTRKVDYDWKEYEANNFLKLVSQINNEKLSLKEDDLILIKSKKIKNSLGIYAAAMKFDNRLEIKKWKEILKNSKKTLYFFGSKADISRYDELQKALPNNKIIRMDGKLKLKESLNEISKMEEFISEDGGVFHMAVCTGVPSTSYWLHGKDNMKKWKAPFKKHKGVLLK